MGSGVRRYLGVATLTAVLGGCGDATPTGVVDVQTAWQDVDVLGGTRSYRLYVPPALRTADGSAPTPAPLLLLFHGATQGAAGVELMSWLYRAADEAGMLVAYPEAAGDYWNTPNSPPSYWNVPDVQFAEAVVEDVALGYGVDRERVFVAGFSNGAVFAEVLACLRGETIAALAIVGAGISASVSVSCPWNRPVPTVVFFGDADPQFFWDDGLAAAVGMLGGPGSMTWLADHNGCTAEPTIVDLGPDPASGTEAELSRFLDCTGGADVDFYRMVRGGHTWPGSPLNLGAAFGRKNRAIDASSVMVDFFLSHPRGTGS